MFLGVKRSEKIKEGNKSYVKMTKKIFYVELIRGESKVLALKTHSFNT